MRSAEGSLRCPGSPRPDPPAVAQAVVAEVVAAAPPALEVLATGLPLVEGTIAGLVAGERTTIVPVLLAMLFAAAWAFYRQIALALAVLLPALSPCSRSRCSPPGWGVPRRRARGSGRVGARRTRAARAGSAAGLRAGATPIG